MTALATGDGRPFVAAMADEMSWTIIGSSPWSGTRSPKRAVVEGLLGADGELRRPVHHADTELMTSALVDPLPPAPQRAARS